MAKIGKTDCSRKKRLAMKSLILHRPDDVEVQRSTASADRRAASATGKAQSLGGGYCYCRGSFGGSGDLAPLREHPKGESHFQNFDR